MVTTARWASFSLRNRRTTSDMPSRGVKVQKVEPLVAVVRVIPSE